MEHIISINWFNNFIQNIEYYEPYISYATNTIRIGFTNKYGDKLYFFHIDPAWRIVLNNEILINSYNYQKNENYTEEENNKEEKKFNNWCSKTEFMKNEKINKIFVLETADLIIEWKNGATLNKFVNDIKSPDYYFYDKVNYKVYDFMYKKIIQDDLKNKN
jgi:hypothetical protein